ncbi:MAG: SpoIIE family protein phosphatase [Spirochaetales bacterium]|nr:SpoIIE family protein phosphatase [Spirochaetales bacterium]
MNSTSEPDIQKRKGKIRKQLLMLIIPIAVIPIALIMLFVSVHVYNKLLTQNINYYDTVLSQVNINLDSVYEQYARTLSSMLDTTAFRNYVAEPATHSIQEEEETDLALLGDDRSDFGLRNTVQEKIDGFVYIYQMNKYSPKTKTDWKLTFCNDNGARPSDPNYEKIIQDPFFLKVKNDNNIKLAIGKFQNGTIPSMDGDKQTVLLYPFYPEPPDDPSDTFDTFLLVVLNTNFIRNFYGSIDQLKFGTLYILDADGNMMNYNHPAVSAVDDYDDSDYYNYDREKYRYQLDGDEKKPEGELLFFNDYRMLNTDFNILTDSKVLEILHRVPDEDEEYDYQAERNFVRYHGKKFVMVKKKSDVTGVQLVYFHPTKQILKPVSEIISVLVIIAILVILVIVVISIFFSRTFTRPIADLVGATKEVAEGNYTHFLKSSSDNEIGVLTDNFNAMIKNIKAYQDKLLSAEREKSELDLAAKIQTCLLPGIPTQEYYDITATMIPASEVGGDYYDLISEENGRLWFGIGDVSGHGLTSGLIMMMAQTAFNTVLLNKPDIASDKLIADVNRVMYQNIKQRLGEDHFMTMAMIVADPDGMVNHSGAHLDILVYRYATKTVERIETGGVWLGLIPEIDENTMVSSFKLEKNDTFLLYTDGLIEATNENNELYDMDRLCEKFRELGERPVKEIEDEIISDVFSFMHEQKDDITFVVARKK